MQIISGANMSVPTQLVRFLFNPFLSHLIVLGGPPITGAPATGGATGGRERSELELTRINQIEYGRLMAAEAHIKKKNVISISKNMIQLL